MQVEPGQLGLDYLGLHFAFCSEQCRQRFQANPHLYVGQPGQPAPKQQGAEIVKERTLRLNHPLSDTQAREIISALQNMMGIHRVTVEGDRIRICYDLLQVTTEQIEQQIEATGEQLQGGLGTALRRAFIHYLEETELASLESSGSTHGHHHH